MDLSETLSHAEAPATGTTFTVALGADPRKDFVDACSVADQGSGAEIVVHADDLDALADALRSAARIIRARRPREYWTICAGNTSEILYGPEGPLLFGSEDEAARYRRTLGGKGRIASFVVAGPNDKTSKESHGEAER